MSLSFWSVGGEPFELALDMVRGNARASWTRRRQGHSHSARFDVPSKDVRQLYDFLLSCQISEFVMYNDIRADNRIGCNLKLTIPVDEGNQEEAVVQLADSGTTLVTDKWIPAWELLCAALKNWSDHLLARSTVSFEVLFENALQQKGFELRLDDARSLDALEPPVRWLPEGQRVVLHGPQGLHQMKLVIDAHEYTTEVLIRPDKAFALSYDPSFQLSAFTVSEPADEEEAPVEPASCLQTCITIAMCRMGERASLLELEREQQAVQNFPAEDEVARLEPPLRVTVSIQTAGETLPQLRESTARHIIVSVPVAPSPDLSAALVAAISMNRSLQYIGFLGHSPQPRDVGTLVSTCRALRSVRGVGLSANLLQALRGAENIREVGIAPQQIDRLQNAHLLEQILSLPGLQSVDLSGADLGASDDLVRMMDHSLRAQNCIQLMYVRRNSLRPKTMCGILDCFNDKSTSVLRGLYLRQNSIGVESVRRIANWMLYGKAKLRYLELSLNQLGEEASFQVARILHATNKTDPLVHLDISSNPEMPLQYICQALQWNDTLTSLELSGNTLDRDSSKQLATALVDNTTLTTLRLASMVNLDDEQFAFFFGPSLQVNSGLQVLDLSTNKLGARFAASMAAVLSSNKALRSLILNDNLIESEGAITLLESVTSNRESRLRILSVKRNLLSDTRLERLVQLLNARSALTRFEIAGNPVAGHQLFRQVRNTLDVT